MANVVRDAWLSNRKQKQKGEEENHVHTLGTHVYNCAPYQRRKHHQHQMAGSRQKAASSSKHQTPPNQTAETISHKASVMAALSQSRSG